MPAGGQGGFKIIPLYVCALAGAIVSVLLAAWLAQRGINEVNDIIDPCMHGGIYNKTSMTCDCSTSRGLFKGDYCEDHDCQHFSVLTRYSSAIRDNVVSLYGCRCAKGPEKRWTGFLCNKCYANGFGDDDCMGDCDGSRLAAYNYTRPGHTDAQITPGPMQQCNKICLPHGSIQDCNELDLSYDGICNACNGHGTCDAEGECVCTDGYFDNEEGIQCVEACVDENGDPICGENAICEIVNNQPKCFCKEGFWDEPKCDVICPGINPVTFEGEACFGHGSCYYDGVTQKIEFNVTEYDHAFCACDATYVATGSPACQWECPRKPTVQVPCSGHGKCHINADKDNVECTCSSGDEQADNWYGRRCDCNEIYTCFGHGECDDYTGECICHNGGLQADIIPTLKDIRIFTNIHDHYVPDTYKFASPAHYVELDSDVYTLFEGMVLNISDGTSGYGATPDFPITIKTVVQEGTLQLGEFDEVEATALANYFEMTPLAIPNTDPINYEAIDGYYFRFEFNWNPEIKPDLGYYDGPRCLECQKNWFPPPTMQDTQEACNVYCNPSAEYMWHDDRAVDIYPFSGQPGFGCWGRGQCEYDPDPEEPDKLPTCKCDEGTNPETYCAQCMPDLYPKLQWTTNPTEKHCSQQCVATTCNGHGYCNPHAFNTEDDHLCVCDLNRFGMDTLNASIKCSGCKDHWYPNDPDALNACSDWCSDDLRTNMDSGCLNLIKTYKDTMEDISLLASNFQEQELELQRRIPAPELERIINCLNCQAGTCDREGQCVCPPGVTGIECQRACLMHNGEICAGHGECGQNDLFLYFNPESELTQCECDPEDPYTEETRDYYQRMGIVLDPPPSKNYYGLACQYHCPTYNEDICAGRGTCKPIPVPGGARCKESIQLSEDDNPFSCKNVMAGEDLDGVFCSVTASPWDSKAAELYKTQSYFVAPSPGAIQCKTTQCQADINDRDWSQYCVSMLKGLYPAELNSPLCAHNKEKDSECAGLNGHIKCSTALEDAFSRAKTCSDFDLIDADNDQTIESVRIYDAWDVEQMGVTTVVLNVKYLFNNDDMLNWREMTPFVFHVTAQSNGEEYLAERDGQSIHMYRDIDNTLVIDAIGCGDSYGLRWNQIITGADADGTGYLSYAQDRCELTDCTVEQFTMNPWHGFETVREGGYLSDGSDGFLLTQMAVQGGEIGVTSQITVEKAARVAINDARYNQAGYFVRHIDGRVWYYTQAPPRNSVGQFFYEEDPAFTTYRAGIPISNQQGCCKCNDQRDPLLTKALDINNHEYYLHTIQLYHDKTWCEMSNHIFENSGALNDDCRGDTARVGNYDNMETTCFGYSDRKDCTMDDYCLYDLSVDYQKELKNKCNQMKGRATMCDNDLQCIYNQNTGACDVRSFCRPRECEDTINDIGISPFCTDLGLPDWCPADPTNVEVSFKVFSGENVYLINMDRKQIAADDINDCAQKVAILGHDMFEYSTEGCFWYNKIFDLQTGTDGDKTTYKINGYSEAGLSAYKMQWEDQCFALSAEVTEVTRAASIPFKPSELFFMCWNLNEKNYPFVMSAMGAPKGGIKLLHGDQYKLFVSSVGNAKQDDRWNVEDFPVSDKIEVNSEWCKNHINTRYPTGDMESWADTTKFSRTSTFTSQEYATICSPGVNDPDLSLGFHSDPLLAAKHALFWDAVFKRQYSEEWACTTRDREEEDTWQPGTPFSIKCYEYSSASGWLVKEEFPMRDPNLRFDYLGLMTPKELESCVITPNLDAYVWKTPEYDVMSRTRTSCTNVKRTTKEILNNGIIYETLKDPFARTTIPNGQDAVFAEADSRANPGLIVPNLLYRSRLRGINTDEEDVFYVHRPGTCVGDCKIHTKPPFNLTDDFFDDADGYDEIRAWCDEHMECDGFSYKESTRHWYPWSFIGGSYEYKEYTGIVSYIKASSIEDDCLSFVSDIDLFIPPESKASRYSVPQASQTRLVKEGVVEFTKVQSGAVHMDGWADLLNLERSSRFYVSGSNLPNNVLLVEYKKITVDVSALTTSHTSRHHAEISCFETNSDTCAGLVYTDDVFDKYGFGPEGSVIYELPSGVTAVPTELGNAYFAPNLFKFEISKENKIYPSSPIESPYDVTIMWPAADYYGERDIQCEEQWSWALTPPEPNLAWCWSPTWRDTEWKHGDVIISADKLIVIVAVATIQSAGTPSPKFLSVAQAEAYAVSLDMPAQSHPCGEHYHCPGGTYDEWAAAAGIPNNDDINVFGIKEIFESIRTYRTNMPHGIIHETTFHIPRSIEEPLEIQPIPLCMVNPRQVGLSSVNSDGVKSCTVHWDHWTADVNVEGGCKFEALYYPNGTLSITPDGITINGEYDIGMITPEATPMSRVGTWVEAKRDTVVNIPHEGPPAMVSKTETIAYIPLLTFQTEGTIALSFTRNGQECFGMDIVDDVAYINKNYNLSIPKSPTGWEIKYEDGMLSVNNNPGVEFRGGVVPNRIHIWNTISNSSGRVTNLMRNGELYTDDWKMTNQVEWSTQLSMHPGRTYAAVQDGMQLYEESMDLAIHPKWQPGAWVPAQSTQSDSITFNTGIWQDDKARCIRWAMDYDWVISKPNTGPVRYVGLNGRTCSVYWDTILARSGTEPGETTELPRTQYHISGWMYADASASSLRTLKVTDAAGNPITTIRQRGGRLLDDNDYPTTFEVRQDEWHYWSVDVSRVRPVHQQVQIQIADSDYETEENPDDDYLAFWNPTYEDDGIYLARKLLVTPIIKTDVLHIPHPGFYTPESNKKVGNPTIHTVSCNAGNDCATKCKTIAYGLSASHFAVSESQDNYCETGTSMVDHIGMRGYTMTSSIDAVWRISHVDVELNSAYFIPEVEDQAYLASGLENVQTSIITYMYTVVVEIDEMPTLEAQFVASSASLDGGKIIMQNWGFDKTKWRIEGLKARNRRAASLCNVQDTLHKMVDEIAIQECTFSHDCYKELDKVNKFHMCDENLKYAAPPEIEGQNARDLASEMQWIAYCDYAFPHSLHYDGLEEKCEGLWIYMKLNDDEPVSFGIDVELKQPLGVKYTKCNDDTCENINQGFLSHLKCANNCKKAVFEYIDATDNVASYPLWDELDVITVKTVDWKLVRCNSQNDHIGIHTGDWLLQCKSINERFPVLECAEGRQTESWASDEKKSLGPGNSVSECRERVRIGMLNGEYPTAIEIGSGTCWGMFNTETFPKVLTPEAGIQTCFIRYGGVPDIRNPVSGYTVPDCETYPFDSTIFKDCFLKTEQYTISCSDTCVNRLRTEVDQKDCKKVENLRNIARLTGNECAQGACQQELDEVISKQFCAYQEQYHNIVPYEIEASHSLYIPDLQTTSCTEQCTSHLERSLSYEDWEGWCLSYASGEILGFCSRTDCDCEAGYDGTQCEMKCPMGSADGVDATCSGTNGFCVPEVWKA